MPQALTIETPLVAAGIEGTEFVLGVSKSEADLWVFEGRVRVWNPQGQLEVRSGEGALARPGQAPERRVLVKPREAVEWALYYPPLVDPRPESYPPALRATLSAYRVNDLPAAFAALERVPVGDRDGLYLLLRAGLLLSVGRVAKAEADLAEAERADPKSDGVSALRSVIALVRDQKDDALRLAEMGAELDPNSPLPQAALSYAHQGRFDIEKALEHAKRAVELAPEDALLWARVSELELSRGDLDAALEAAQKAETLSPALARTQTVLGYAYLTRIEVDKAKSAFERAIQGDPADPLPRLGLGLAKIRDGDLEEGTREIETAASLDPNNSLVRSYLGKAYYEQKRDGLASSEYEQAKLLDPKDPTPWFYDAIHKQTTNRPVEALHDLQRSIDLNENRAVYRSRLLLDEDLAARSASLGRIYRDLGFEQRGLVEGWKSVNTDPGDYSGHRLLADSYSALPRHEIARVSELLQSQLLQPLNLTPVQPQLAQSDLLILEGSGPSELAFNEFNSLFARDRLSFQPSGIFGSNDTLGDEVTQSGLWGRFSYSLGQTHFETEGFRDNNDLEQDIYNAFAQVSLAPNASVQTEFRYQDTESGDLRLRFDPEAFLPNQRVESLRQTARLGLLYEPTINDTVIVSLLYLDSNRQLSNHADTIESVESEGFDIQTIDDELTVSERQAYTAELQYLGQFGALSVIAGVGYVTEDRTDRDSVTQVTNILLPDMSEPIPADIQSHTDISDLGTQYINTYLYTDIDISPYLTWITGLSFNDFESRSVDRATINPKLGAIWRVSPSTTLRAAWFKTVKRPFASQQTVEPTQVAGFNQVFDDIDGSKSQRYGLAIDQRFGSDLFIGLEASWRDLETPFFNKDAGTSVLQVQHEQFHRAYLYWTPVTSLALSAGYFFEDIDKRFPTTEKDTITTHRTPLELRFYHPTGFFARASATYVNQDVATADAIGDDRFWVTDLSFGYRLPRRWGVAQVGIKNIFDQEFHFHDINFNTGEPVIPLFQPERVIFTQFTFSF